MTESVSTWGHPAATPALSVVMPVHNALPHLDQAIESVLGQSFGDFEFVILDDGSTDGSGHRLRHWATIDPRIRLLEVDENLGPVRSSNMVARAARAPLVARMDADDISHPERLSQSFAIMSRHADVGVVASVSEIIDASGRKLRDPEIWRLSRRSAFVPFAHGSMTYRREIFDRSGGYREQCEYWEDQDLVLRMAEISKIVVIPWPLYSVRQSTTSTRVVSSQQRLEQALDGAYRAMDRFQRTRRYDGLFDRDVQSDSKLDPRVFIAMGSVRLWAKGRPRLFRRLLKRARISIDARTASAIIWTAWASASPASLRIFLMLLLQGRNRFTGDPGLATRPLQWQPLAGSRPIEQEPKR